jgi:hypothetical protein
MPIIQGEKRVSRMLDSIMFFKVCGIRALMYFCIDCLFFTVSSSPVGTSSLLKAESMMLLNIMNRSIAIAIFNHDETSR